MDLALRILAWLTDHHGPLVELVVALAVLALVLL